MASPYQLTIELTSKQLDAFGETESRIAIAKTEGGSSPSVVWQSLRPIEELTMTWEENYGIYATETEMKGGAKIVSTARTKGNAVKGEEYALAKNGFFVAQENPGNPGSYYATNLYTSNERPMGFGLTQAAETSAGGALPVNPISYAPVLPLSKAAMTPHTTLNIWLQSSVLGGSVVTEITGPQTKLEFGGKNTEYSLIYNNGKFEAKGGKAVEGLSVETFEPVYY